MLTEDSYWDNRAKKYGHTGWSDFATYYYDQHLRIKAIENIIVARGSKYKTALDYGCGTGEFSKTLSGLCDKVIATDISDKVISIAKSKNNCMSIEYLPLNDNIFNNNYDLIISITVLQHILDNAALSELISKFKSSLSDRGSIIILESFANEDTDSDYIKSRKVNELIGLFKDAGLTLKSLYNFYHPINIPTELYNKYRRNICTRILNRLSHYSLPMVKPLLKLIAQNISDKDNGIVDKESITKILVFGR